MDSGKLLKELLDRNEQYLLPGFEKLTDAELRQRVTPIANPVGWLLSPSAMMQFCTVTFTMGGQPAVW